jgi:3-phenylpropionate/trans-cinnamate dioxygenase ferredoxin subunit
MSAREGHWVDVCAAADLARTGRHVVDIDGCSILLLRLPDRVHALRNECTHLELPLSNGRVSGDTLMCLHHGARFCIADGRPISGPAVRAVATYPTRVSAGRVEIDYVADRNGLMAAIRRER